jgi:hypothetical protein
MSGMGAKSDDEVYREWKKLVNMTTSELQRFVDSPEGRRAGLSRAEAKEQGIRSGRDSARAILRMKAKKKDDWTKSDWEWARRQVGFIKRMRGAKGPLRDKNGEPTRKLLALKIWGHDPEKLKGNRRIQIELDVATEIGVTLAEQTALEMREWIERAGGTRDAAMTRLGDYPTPLANFGARISGEEVWAQVVHAPGPEGKFGLGGGIGRVESLEGPVPGVWGIEIVLNANYPIIAYATPEQDMVEDVVRTMVHELTHFADPGVRVERKVAAYQRPRTEEEFQRYVDHPAEVKAFGQQVVFDALIISDEIRRRGYSKKEALRGGMALSPAWQHAVQHMSERNQQRVMRDTYQEFAERGLV